MVKSAKPKGKTTAYGYFLKACLDEHNEKYPDNKAKFGEVSSECAEAWKNMSDAQKGPFIELADADKERFKQEMDAFVVAGGAKGKGKRRKKDPNAPKRPLSAFFQFTKAKRAEVQEANPEWKITQVAKELGRLWKETSEEEKRKYERLAEEAKMRYDEEKLRYDEGIGANGQASDGEAGEEEEDGSDSEASEPEEDGAEPSDGEGKGESEGQKQESD